VSDLGRKKTEPNLVWLKLAFAPHLWKYFYKSKLTATFLATASSQQLQEVLKIELKVAELIEQQLKLDLKAKLLELQTKNTVFISREHPKFPDNLKELNQPPLGFFAQGNLELLKKIKVAIVGARKCTSYGRQIAFEFSQTLAEAGVVVISGLAVGIDTQAHLGALKNGTIAILGSGFNHLYPPINKSLTVEIVKNNGLLLTEYPPSWPVKAQHFPARNRLIAALAECVIIVEAAAKSGALITADLALELGREVMAVPGSIKNPFATGCHSLIKQGAYPLTDINELLSMLRLPSRVESKKQLSEAESKFLNCIDFTGTPLDLIIAKAKVTPNEALSLLTALELKGCIKKEGSKLIRVQ